MIETHSLTRRYGDRVVVDRVNLSVKRGAIVGFLGPNGAGKSTTLRMLAGFLPPTSGSATINGFDVVEDKIAAQRSIGYMPESAPLYSELRVSEYLAFRAEIKGLSGKAKRDGVDRALDFGDLRDLAGRLCGELSKGQKQRVGLADALVAAPPLLILDEPTEGLDPNQILRFRERLRELRGKHTVLLSTHILQEVEAVCEEVVILNKGKVVAAGPIAEVLTARGNDRLVKVVFTPKDALDDATLTERVTAIVTAVDGVTLAHASRIDGRVLAEVKLAEADAIEALVAALVTGGHRVRSVEPTAGSLEEVFHQLTVPVTADSTKAA